MNLRILAALIVLACCTRKAGNEGLKSTAVHIGTNEHQLPFQISVERQIVNVGSAQIRSPQIISFLSQRTFRRLICRV